ncbi:MAG: M81 family metallopeptidase, partial [Armatimonadetes bacterium]|nr:M81 family metallopeptidase [Armatimonadota bacterium]
VPGGFLDATKEAGAEVIPSLAASATPSGLVERDTYETLVGRLLDDVQAAKKRGLDGVLLALHGAMVAEGVDDPEGDILQRVRDIAGETPIAYVLDYHANMTPLMVTAADAVCIYDTYPHIDNHERGVEAARLLFGTLEGRLRPVMALAQPLLMPGLLAQCTEFEPMKSIFARVREVERRPGILNVTLAAGFPYSDVPQAGFAVVAVADRDRRLAEETAQEVADHIWSRRKEFVRQGVPVAEAVGQAMKSEKTPVVLADVADNPGGGAAGDGTVILQDLLREGATGAAVGVMADPEAVAKCIEAGVGNTVTVDVGGKTDDLHGPPVRVTGRVRLISDGAFTQTVMAVGVPVRLGRTAVLQVDGVEIILTERRYQALDPQAFRGQGIEPLDRRIVVLKSSVHFRAGFTPLARGGIIEVDGPGLSSSNLTRFAFKRVRRPIFPLDEI